MRWFDCHWGLLLACAAACTQAPLLLATLDGGGADARPDPDGDVRRPPDGDVSPDGAPPDGPPPVDAAAARDALGPAALDGSTCTPALGSAVVKLGCDSLQMAVLQHDGAPAELRLSGRLFVTSLVCALVDGVDILTDAVGSTLVQHLAGSTTPVTEFEQELARGPAADAIAARCASDNPAQRFEVYGIVVRGRIDGGAFEADCARAEGGSRWPPALRVTCHRNVDEPPSFATADVGQSMIMGMLFTSSEVRADLPHGAGGALSSLDDTIELIPLRSTFDPNPPLAARAVSGWTTSATETIPPSAPESDLWVESTTAQLGIDVCPPIMVGPPDPNFIPPPVFLTRLTGQGGRGPYSTEFLVSDCHTTSF